MPFVLTLTDEGGASRHWIETLHGDVARRWYQIYRTSDWDGLRAQGADTFHTLATKAEVARARAYGKRCVLIHTRDVKAEEIGPGRSKQAPAAGEEGWNTSIRGRC